MSRADRAIEFECQDCRFVFATDSFDVIERGTCDGCASKQKRNLGREDRMEQKNLAIAPLPATTVTDEAMWKLIAGGDLKGLNDKQKTEYYLQLCSSLGMNPATQPFEYITLNGKLRLYAKKDATDQLRQIRGVSILGKPEIVDDGEYITATVSVEDKSGRSDSDIGVVFAGKNTGEMRANLRMKALTKAKRRATLSVCGLGMLDESEVEDIPNVRVVRSTKDVSYDLPPASITVAPEDESQETNTEEDMEEALPPSVSEKSEKVLAAFKSYGVTKEQLENLIQTDCEAWTEDNLAGFRLLFKELKNGATWADVERTKAETLKAHATA